MEARREPFLAFEDSAVSALAVEVVEEKMQVYATISADEGGGS